MAFVQHMPNSASSHVRAGSVGVRGQMAVGDCAKAQPQSLNVSVVLQVLCACGAAL